jgi:hypothetical protein
VAGLFNPLGSGPEEKEDLVKSQRVTIMEHFIFSVIGKWQNKRHLRIEVNIWAKGGGFKVPKVIILDGNGEPLKDEKGKVETMDHLKYDPVTHTEHGFATLNIGDYLPDTDLSNLSIQPEYIGNIVTKQIEYENEKP